MCYYIRINEYKELIMAKKIFVFILTMFLTQTINAQKLENYDALYATLLDGKSVKTIIDFSKCKITEGGNKPIRHILGAMIENFMISDKTKGISISHSFLNSLDKRTPYGSYGYRLGDITVMPNNNVIVDTVVVR